MSFGAAVTPRRFERYLSSLRTLIIPICFFAAVLSATGCKRTERATPKNPENKSGQEKTILIGLIPEQNIFKQMDRYEPLAAYLSKRTGVAIRLMVLPRYGNIISNFISGDMDSAFFGSFTYALAHKRLGVEVLARPVSLNGASTYHGLLFVRKDSGIKSILDMKGKRFAFVDKATTAGYLLPAAYFKKHGEQYRTYLKEIYFTGTHEDAIYDVLNGKADIGAAKNTVYERLAEIDAKIRNELVVLERSPDVPENGLAVRKDLDETVKMRLKAALLAMDKDQEGSAVLKTFGAQRFIETIDNDYRPVYTYAQEAGLDLAAYDYLNE
ncbi:MAG: phosphate/phosphite/phosphonate ABC transporter substrate-binding protein [Nitrospiraceae bacterium]|nr:phosphate/phosphite/phosphonate ABC transporter substrate-binding protein [Nitrospiraceae bacterium]